MAALLSPHRRPTLVAAALAAALIGLSGPPPAAAQDEGGPAVHVVGWGETLGTIAAQYGVPLDAIIRANDLTQPDRLYAGQQLVIPGGGAPAAPASGTHTVQPGEGLYRIAARYGVSVADLMAANGLADPDSIYAGQVLAIPVPGSAPAPAPAASGATGGPQSAGGTHVVQPGETLFRISLRYGVSVAALSAANGLLNPGQIRAGQVLAIPGAAAAPAPLPPAASTPVVGTHVVQPGETLGAIAARYGLSLAALAQANNLSNPSLLFTGQSLAIPGGGTTSGPAAGTPTPSAAGGTHTVQQGETLFRISLRYGVSVAALSAANGLGAGDTIYSGQTLTIPAGGATAPAPAPAVSVPAPTVTRGKQIVVVLAQQRVYAFENGQLLRQFVVSTGLPATPTVQGDYAVYLKYDAQRMAGPGYDLPGVPWVMYFYQGYALHGTYWHNNFGQPMSHGCVNMRTPEAEWLYGWAPVGTPVRVIWSA